MWVHLGSKFLPLGAPLVDFLTTIPDRWKAITALGGAVGVGVGMGMGGAMWTYKMGNLPQEVATISASVAAHDDAIRQLARADTAIIARLDAIICIQIAEETMTPVRACVR